jgi:nucleotide-binding universal stress UspA family protein/anti-anti-sigma regulatory factor
MIIEAREDVVQLEGELDKNLWPTIQAAANLLLRQHVEGIIVDGSGLTGCSAEGAKTFRDAMNYIERYRARIVVCGLPENVMEVIRAVPGVRSRLPVTATLEEARASLRLCAPGGNRATGGARAPQSILVPLLRPDHTEAASTLACRLAKAASKADGTQKSRLHLAYILEVPRHLPLTAPLPEEEALASQALAAATAAARSEGVAAEPQVTRTRDAGEEIVTQATALEASLIVLAYLPSDDPDDTLMQRVSRTVFDRSPCEVILNKQPVR